VIKNKVFFFGDYEGLRRRQGSTAHGECATALERKQRLHQLRRADYGTKGTQRRPRSDHAHRNDSGSRDHAGGTIGVVDPVSGLTATKTGFARDPFGTCAAVPAAFTLVAAASNILPPGGSMRTPLSC